MIKQRSGLAHVDHYLDDFIFAGAKNTKDCEKLMSCFSNVCAELGVPIAPEKTIGPSTVLTFLGIEIDTTNGLVRIPAEKIARVKKDIETTLDRKKVKLSVLQSLVGSLNFFTRVIISGRAFNRRFYDAMMGAKKKKNFFTWSKYPME